MSEENEKNVEPVVAVVADEGAMESAVESVGGAANVASAVPGNLQQSVFGKISGKLEKLAGEAGKVFRKGKGRPRKDGLPGAADKLVDLATGEASPAAAQPALAAAVAVPRSAGDSLFHRSVVSGAKGLIRGLADYCKSLARRAGMDAGWIERTFAKAEPEPEVLADFSDALKMVLEKHNVSTEHGPEIALAISGARLVAPYGVLIVELRAEVARRVQAEAAADQRATDERKA